jgi:muconolactone delta-isomerase
MRFLITTKPFLEIKQEAAQPMMEGLIGWINKYKATGQMKDAWTYCAKPGGGGILDVRSLEELDSIMREFPFFFLSNVEVEPLTDLETSIRKSIEVFRQQAGGH